MSLFLDALRGSPVPRRPLWLMRQAGRYLPEYRALRAKHDFSTLSREPSLAAEVTLQPLRRFPLDAAIVFADLMSPIAALGIPFDFAPGPVLESPVRSAADIASLAEPVRGEIAPEVMETLRLVKSELGQRVPVIGFAGAPWTLAAYLVEGNGRRGFPALRAMAAGAPEILTSLMERLADLVVAYAKDQVEAGADAVQIFDSWAGLLCLRDWERLSRPYLLKVLEGIAGTGVPRILFFQDAPHLVDAYAALPAEAVSVDWRTDVPALQRRLNGSKAVQGNLDPALLLAGPETTAAAARDLLQRVAPRGHVFNLGHGILPDTPLASVEALVEAVHGEERERGDTVH